MPQHPTATSDVAVIGGGVIGLAVAWRAAQRGLSVCVLERGELGAGASHVAAGMLAPVTEADAGELALLELGLRSARAWPAFADELAQAAGADPGLRRSGALVVARDRDEAEALERELALRSSSGSTCSACCRARRARPRAGARADGAAGARRARRPQRRPARASCSRSPRPHAAPASRCARAPPSSASSTRAAASPASASPAARSCRAARVVVAAGAWSGAIEGLPRIPLRPVKGQILRLRDPAGAGPARADRAMARTPPATSSRAATGATCSARRWRSAASTRPSPPAGCTSCCAMPASSCPACTSSCRGDVGGPAPGDARQRPAARARRGARRAALGDRPPPQRDPARAGQRRHRRRRPRAARRRRRRRFAAARFEGVHA